MRVRPLQSTAQSHEVRVSSEDVPTIACRFIFDAELVNGETGAFFHHFVPDNGDLDVGEGGGIGAGEEIVFFVVFGSEGGVGSVAGG